jgi:2-C-methyl-D-erythritol 4-phosphate cytidylyltransferase
LLPDVGVVVVAGGRGIRAGGEVPKQFRTVAGAPLVLHALRAFLRHPGVGCVVLVLPPPNAARPPDWLAPLVGQRLLLAAGGETRAESCLNGLTALPPACTIVLVHDGARPNPDAAVVDAIIAEARGGHGAIAALPVSDTIKEAGPDQTVLRTVPRDQLWRAQTPQGFPRELLARAFAQRDPASVATDEAMLVEEVGGTVRLIPDSPWNLKVTTSEDLLLAEWVLGRGA